MATPKSRQLKVVTLTIGGTSFAAQLKTWKIENSTQAGDTTYTFGDDPNEGGAIIEDTDPAWSFTGTFLADWSVGGLSDFLTVHDNENAAFVLDHLPNIVGEHVRWTGTVKIVAPSVGGDARTTETTEVSMKFAGKPVYTRVG